MPQSCLSTTKRQDTWLSPSEWTRTFWMCLCLQTSNVFSQKSPRCLSSHQLSWLVPTFPTKILTASKKTKTARTTHTRATQTESRRKVASTRLNLKTKSSHLAHWKSTSKTSLRSQVATVRAYSLSAQLPPRRSTTLRYTVGTQLLPFTRAQATPLRSRWDRGWSTTRRTWCTRLSPPFQKFHSST